MTLSYAIIGTGALGGYYGGRLAKSGNNVHFLLHSDYEYVKANGLKVNSVTGDFVINPINAYKSTSEMPKCDVVLVCMKTTQNHLLKDMLPPILHDNSVIILLQNGLCLEEELAVQFPNHTIMGAMAFICSSKTGKGEISHFDYGKINAGVFQHDREETVLQIKNDFDKAEVPFDIAPDLALARWKKLVWNIPYNGLTVALNTTTDKIMKSEAARQLVIDMMNEVVDAANACNVKLERSFVDEMLTLTDNMTPYSPSMKLDFDNRRKMEIRAIYSNPIDKAKRHGYHMKKVEMLQQQLFFIEENIIFC